MVKGTNRTVIEINDTGNNMFEKVLLFVTPEYGNLSSKQLKSEAKKLIEKYYPDMVDATKIRNIYRRRKIIKMACIAGGILLAFCIAAILVF